MKDTDAALDFAARVGVFLFRARLYSTNFVQGLLKPIYEKFPISKLPDAVQKLRDGKVAGRCVVDFNS